MFPLLLNITISVLKHLSVLRQHVHDESQGKNEQNHNIMMYGCVLCYQISLIIAINDYIKCKLFLVICSLIL